MRATLALVLLGVVGCGTDDGTAWVANFNPPASPAGYTRFVSPTIKAIAPGADVEYCSWIADPSMTARDVMDVVGSQSPTGHHAVLYDERHRASGRELSRLHRR